LWSTFCNQRGARVQDTTTFKTYLNILNEKSSTIGDVTEDNADTYRVYLKSKKTIEDPYHGLINRGIKVDVDKKIAGLPATTQPKAPETPTTFSHNIFLNPTTTFNIVHPADMNEKNWSVVMRSNSLLHAYRVLDLGEKGGKFVERSLYPSFVLKPRSFWNYQISATAEVDSIAEQKQTIRVPRFRIDDDSYIRQYEQKTSVSRAIAEACLSETDAKLAIEGGAFGYSASASASWGESKSSSSSSSTKEDTRIMTITYNFPRVVIDFEPAELDLSEDMKADLAKVDSADAVDVFKSKYGRFFATRVQLGGRLHSSEESTSTDAAASAAQAKSMRAAAAFSFSSPWVQASGSVSHSNSSNSSSESKDSASTSTISWEAQGGDTLQCNNPPAWAYTVGSFYNWRVVKQTKVVSLEEIISAVPGYQDVKENFATLLAARDKKDAKPEPKPKAPAQQTIKFKMSIGIDNAYLALPTTPSSDSYGQLIEKLVDAEDPVTAERLNFLSELSTERSESVPLQLLQKTEGAIKEFAVTTDKKDQHKKTQANRPPIQLKLYHPYKIRTAGGGDASKERWLGVNPTLPGYLTEAIIWAGKAEHATHFAFVPYSLSPVTAYVEPGTVLQLVLYDREKQQLGSASPWWAKAELETDEDPPTYPSKVGTDTRWFNRYYAPFLIEYS
ncbi:hypothetical protein P170DRAFT_363984, partial [Aspergillus steynii IBT 23096]